MAVADLAAPDQVAEPVERGRPPRRARRRRWAFLGVVPFFAYISIFLLIPTGELIVDAFKTANGRFTFANVEAIVHAPYVPAFEFSLEVSAICALMGGLLGFLVANAVLHDGMPRFLRGTFSSFSGMAANFAGVPLAFAYVATLGAEGIVTRLLAHLGFNLSYNFDGLIGLSLVYLYFQLPLMILLVIPSIDGLRREWREAAANLGAGSFRFWWHVGFPIVAPSVFGMMVLLFGNAFSAYATAETLGVTNLVTVWIAQLVNGNITVDPQVAYALAFGMIVIIVVTVTIYTLIQRRASRWLR
ncbi:MAG: ABC transporter permease subunit [Acidimicrobiales bacterium]